MAIIIRQKTFARATLRLPGDLWKRAQHYAIDHDITAAELVKLALEAYLKGKD
jgi:hypothetical protein